MKAFYEQTCAWCGETIAKGASLGRVEAGYAHEACAKDAKRRGKILAGETFRSRAPSTYRRGGKRREGR